jgi:hypothetical protein
VVSNHASWLDILVLNASHRVIFVAKADVAGWPGIGGLARITGTLFVQRDRSDLPRQAREIAARLGAGQRLLVFRKRTSTDGAASLPLSNHPCSARLRLRPAPLLCKTVTVIYTAPDGAGPTTLWWWGDMALAPHLLAFLAFPRQGHVDVVFDNPLTTQAHADRKRLALACETRSETPWKVGSVRGSTTADVSPPPNWRPGDLRATTSPRRQNPGSTAIDRVEPL